MQSGVRAVIGHRDGLVVVGAGDRLDLVVAGVARRVAVLAVLAVERLPGVHEVLGRDRRAVAPDRSLLDLVFDDLRVLALRLDRIDERRVPTAVLFGSSTVGDGSTPKSAWLMSRMLPLELLRFQLTSFFSRARVIVPPVFVGPELQSFGLLSHCASETEDCLADSDDDDPPHAVTTSIDAAPTATRLTSLFVTIPISPPVSYGSRPRGRSAPEGAEAWQPAAL